MKLGLIIISLALHSCSREISPPVTYAEYHDPSIVGFVHEEYTFKTAGKFAYTFTTDLIDQSKYGYGDYFVKGGKLILDFTQEVIEPYSTVEREELTSSDSSYNHYRISVISSAGLPLEGIYVLLTNSRGTPLKRGTTDINGNTEFNLLKGNTPVFLKVHPFLYDHVIYRIADEGSMSFTATMVEKNFGTRVKNRQWKNRIRLKKDVLIIDGKKFVKQ